MPQIGPLEIAVVLLIALLVFGPNRLPDLARQVGGALRELRKIQNNLKADLHEMMSDDSGAGGSPPPTLPPRAGSDGVEGAGALDRGLPPTDVPTSGSAEASGPATPADAEVPPPPEAD